MPTIERHAKPVVGCTPSAENRLPSFALQSSGQRSAPNVRLELFRSPERRNFVLCLLLFGATLVLYRPVAENQFVNFDDDVYILNNGHVRAGLNWTTIRWSFHTFEQANWHPLTWMSHALDCQLFGVHPAGHHLSSVLLHGGSAVILFLLLQSATGFTWRSLMVAALFAFHPVNVESVAWAAERKNVLSMLLFLLALYAYGWYTRRPGLSRYTAVIVLYALALMAKPQVITFPFLLLLWDYWPLRRLAGTEAGRTVEGSADPQYSWMKLVLEKLPLFFLSLADGIVTVAAQHSGHAIKTWTDYGILNRTENAVVAYVRYLKMIFWPSGLAVFYPHASRFGITEVAGAVAILIVVTWLAGRQRSQRPYLIVGWLWFLGSMVPMIGLVQVGGQALADRYAYLPSIGIFLMVVWMAAEWGGRLRLPTPAVAGAAMVVLFAFCMITARQISYWRNTATLWERALAVTDRNFVSHDNLGIFLAQQGQEDDAALHFRAALAIKADDPMATLNLAIYEQGRGNLGSAIERYKFVLGRVSDVEMRANAYANLGSAYRQAGDFHDARQCYEDSLQLAPGRPMSMVGLGLVSLQEGNGLEAAQHFSDAMDIQPTDVGYLLLARALNSAGRVTEAQSAFEKARLMSGDIEQAAKQADALTNTRPRPEQP